MIFSTERSIVIELHANHMRPYDVLMMPLIHMSDGNMNTRYFPRVCAANDQRSIKSYVTQWREGISLTKS